MKKKDINGIPLWKYGLAGMGWAAVMGGLVYLDWKSK